MTKGYTIQAFEKIAVITTMIAVAVSFTLFAFAKTAGAQVRNVSRLGELIVVNNLFDGNGIGSRTGVNNVSDLGELIVVDGLFSGGYGVGGDGTVSGRNVSRLGELIVLNKLFDGNGIGTGGTGVNNVSNLGELIVVDGLFSGSAGVGGVGGVGGGISKVSHLGELIVLNNLFDGNGVGSSRGGTTVEVEAGDTLRSISAQFLGNANRFGEIATANGITNPNLIFVGQRLVIPGTGSSNDLSELIVLDNLFGQQGSIFGF